MIAKHIAFVVLVASTFALAPFAHAGGKFGEAAPDFPPGQFNDGQQYHLSDFAGKVVVLFFYEKDCPTCRGKIPERNAIVQQYQGKPVRFFAVAAGDTLPQAKSYAGGTKLAMPVFADSLSLMEKRYGETISLQNIYQFRVVGPDGKVSGYSMDSKDIDDALKNVELTYKPDDYHAKVRPAVDLFEWNRYADGMHTLKPLLKHKDKEVADSAAKLLAAVKAEGAKWLADADAAAAEEPVKAYDLYAKTAAAFGSEDLGKTASEGLKKLKSNAKVKAELDARKMYDRMVTAMAMVKAPTQGGEFAKFAEGIAKKYPETPTGKRADELKKELGG